MGNPKIHFLQLITIGEEPRRFGDLRPRLHASPHGLRKTHPGANKQRFLVSENTSGCQQKKVPGLGKHMPCANKRFLVSEKACRVQDKVPGLGKSMPCATRFLVSQNMPCAKTKVRFKKSWCSGPRNELVKIGIPIPQEFRSKLGSQFGLDFS